MYGLSAAPPLMPGYTDCGGGLSVAPGQSCPPPPGPLTADQQTALTQATADWNARNARCKVYQTKEYALDIGVGLAVAFLAPGMWKLLAIPAALITEHLYPRSPDCDYGW